VRSRQERFQVELAPSEHGPDEEKNSEMTMPATVSAPHQKKRSPKLVYALVDAISESIRSCTIRPGDKLPPESVIMRNTELAAPWRARRSPVSRPRA